MSRVTSVILVCNSDEPELDKILDQGYQGKLVAVAEAECNGDKWMQAEMFVGGFNYFDLEAFLVRINKHPWQYPEYASLFVQDEGVSNRMTQVWPEQTEKPTTSN